MTAAPHAVLSSITRKAAATAVISALLLAACAVAVPGRVWSNLLLAAYYLITVGTGAAVFLALTNVCGAGWNAAFRRVPEAMTGVLPSAGIVLLAVLAARLPEYAWHHHGEHGPGTFWFKEMWLSPPFFAARAVGIVLLWTVFARTLVRNSQRQDTRPEPSGRPVNTAVSAVFLAVFAMTISAAGVDWIMALEPMWFSTIWGVYQFSGLITAALAVMIIACIVLRQRGPLRGVFRDDHLHDLGRLLIGFSCFWMYIWFSQYMLIWYSNIPEETAYFIRRTHGPWGPIVLSSIVLNWLVPFFVLLPRSCKRSERVMLKVAVVVLLGRWVDLYVMIFPPVVGDMPVFGIPEAATILCAGSLSVLLFLRAFLSSETVPRNDPYLSESLQYHA